MKTPSFIVIGAGRSGTTSLHHYLKQHPDIFMSTPKETNFFAYDGTQPPPSQANPRDARNLHPVRTWEEYRALFANASEAQAIGEASPRYLRDPAVPGRIRRSLPEAKLVAILRDPVARAYSSYLMYVREGLETRSFAEAVRDEQHGRNRDHVSGQWHYLAVGFYYRHLARYLREFPRERILVCLHEDLCHDTRGLLKSIFGFLNVDDGFEPDVSIRHNPAGAPRSRALHWLLRKRPLTTALKHRLPTGLVRATYGPAMALQGRNLAKPSLPASLRAELIAGYRSDILALQDLVQRDLSCWLE